MNDDRGLPRQGIGDGEQVRIAGLRKDGLDDSRSVAKLEEQEAAARTAIVEPPFDCGTPSDVPRCVADLDGRHPVLLSGLVEWARE